MVAMDHVNPMKRMMMKILNLHSYSSGLFSKSGTPSGGGEKVVIDVHDTLSKKGVECLTLCCASDAPLIGQSNINSASKFSSDGEVHWKESWKDIKQQIMALVMEHSDAKIIIHGSDKLLRLVNSMNRPSLFIDHRSNELHKLYHESFFMRDAVDCQFLGGKVITVSDFSMRTKMEKVRKMWPVSPFNYDGHVCFQFVTDELETHALYPHENFAITIGRPEANKNPHVIDKIASRYAFDYKIMTTLHENSKEEAKVYFKERLLKLGGKVQLNKSRAETLTTLAKSFIYVSTTPNESAGITAFESLCLGVPLLLNAKQDHASIMFASEHLKDFCLVNPMENSLIVKEYIDHCKAMTPFDREKIAYTTREKFSQDKMHESLVAFLSSINNVSNGIDL